MAWFRVDDQSTFHSKVMRAGNAAYGAWVRMGCYCNAQLTDGAVSEQVARLIASKKELDAMCAAGLALKTDTGYEIHDYLEYQSSRAEVMQKRESTKDRVTRFRNGQRNSVTPTSGNAGCTDAPSAKGMGGDGRGESSGSSDASPCVDSSRLQVAWSKVFPGMPNLHPLVEALGSLPPEQLPVGVEEKFTDAARRYREAYLEHKRIKIPADPARLADPKHFANIVEVMLGRFDVSMLADPKSARGADQADERRPRPPSLAALKAKVNGAGEEG